jgi:hypothetical protein
MTEPPTPSNAFVPASFDPPTGLDAPLFRLRPLDPVHNVSDHEAWTSSMDHIHATPGFRAEGWPTPMTLEQNRSDLERHAADFTARTGFTYTVLAPTEDVVIGCVYIYPADDGSGADVRSWVRTEDADLDGPLYRAVTAWIATDWPFTQVVYAPRAGMIEPTDRSD